MFLILRIALFLILFMSCNKEKVIVCNTDKSQCLTIIKQDDKRYVFNGKSETYLKNGERNPEYVVFDMSKVPELGYSIFICWINQTEPVLKINQPKAKIIENKFDIDKAKIFTNFNYDERNLPDVMEYHKNGCLELGGDYKVYPKNHGVVLK